MPAGGLRHCGGRSCRERPGRCTHTTRYGQPSDCRNCFRYALAYRERVIAALREDVPAAGQLDLWEQLAFTVGVSPAGVAG